jgi:hypothetical protein
VPELKSDIVSETSRGSDILRGLAQGIADAGLDPDVEMLRLAQHPACAFDVGQLLANTLFTQSPRAVISTVQWLRPIRELLADFVIDERRMSDFLPPVDNALGPLYERLYEPAVMLGSPLRYRTFRINRKMTPGEAGTKLVQKGATLAKAAELLGVASKWNTASLVMEDEIGLAKGTTLLALGSAYLHLHPGIHISDDGAKFGVYAFNELMPAGTLILVRA